MNFRIVFDIRKCAKQNISIDAIAYWDRGKGNKIINSNFFESNKLNVDGIIKIDVFAEERNIYDDFNTYDFIITDKKLKTQPNNSFYYQIKIKPKVINNV